MNTLLLDIGNSRIKWALDDGREFLATGSLATGKAMDLSDAVATHAFARICGVCVAGAAVESAIATALQIPVEWFRSAAACRGVRSAYRDPARLGADRLVALVAAHRRGAAPCVVVSAGTAVTIDALAGGGRHLGGIILPGLVAMREALNAATADVAAGEGRIVEFPDNTDDAVATGAMLALAGAIEQCRSRLAGESPQNVRVLLTGGDATRVGPLVAAPAEVVEHLVLEGLAIATRH